MAKVNLLAFERIVRSASLYTEENISLDSTSHPFEIRNIHESLPIQVKKLFDDTHYSQATFEAFKFIDKTVAKISKTDESGVRLMMNVFNENSPKIKLTECLSDSERDEQMGYKFIFSGAISAIRNPRGHEYSIIESEDECLDHLALASHLLRRMEQAGLSIYQT